VSASKKYRPTVSLSAKTYAKLKEFCEVNNCSMAAVVEHEVNKYLDAQPENLLDEPTRVEEEGPPPESFTPDLPSTAREMYERSRRIP
jgi:hypothetical protein